MTAESVSNIYNDQSSVTGKVSGYYDPAWRPIEEAPTDGTHILALYRWGGETYQTEAWLDRKHGRWRCLHLKMIRAFRWRELPPVLKVSA